MRLAQAGYSIVVNYTTNAKAADEVVAAIKKGGGTAVAVKGDVSQEADVLKIFQDADRLGTLKVLVNSAGIMDHQNRLDEMSGERMKRMFDINILGSFLCAREAVKRMSTKHGGKGGAIVNLSSAAAVLGAPAMGVEYAASKGAIDVLTIGLGREVRRRAFASTRCGRASSTPRADGCMKGGGTVAVKGDVSQEADVLKIFQDADRLGTLKVLVNSAGIMDHQNRLAR